MNDNTDWRGIPECRLTEIVTENITEILGLWANSTTRERSLLHEMDIKSALRQAGVAPDLAAAFTYRIEDLIFVDFRLQFGWRGSPGWWWWRGGGCRALHTKLFGRQHEHPRVYRR